MLYHTNTAYAVLFIHNERYLLMKILAFIAVAFASLFAGGAHAQSYPDFEEVISYTPHSYAEKSEIVCEEPRPANGGGWLGPALGAIVGGGAGSQVGKGSGQAAAAAIGAVLGAQAGGAISNKSTQTQDQSKTCKQVITHRMNGYMLRTSSGREVFMPLRIVNSLSDTNR